MISQNIKILIADSIAHDGIKLIQEFAKVDSIFGLSETALCEKISDYDALIVRSATQVTANVIRAGEKLKIIGRAGTGVDNIDLAAATEKGIIVVNAPQGNTIAAAEHSVALMLSLARHIPQADKSLSTGKWERSNFVGAELRGRTLGLIGFGPVGAAVARRAIGLEMSVIAHDPFVPAERLRSLGVESVTLKDLFKKSDFISFHTPLTPQTKGMISDDQINLMKTGTRIINAARGGILDEDALLRGIESGKIAGAALDVFATEPPKSDSPLLNNPKIITTPHLGASTQEAQERVSIDVAKQIVDVLKGNPPTYPVNAPLVSPEIMKDVGPYMKVANLLGSLAAQLVNDQLTSIKLDISGEIAEQGVVLLKSSAIAGLLKPISEDVVTLVNANLAAEKHGWVIEERLFSSHEIFHNLIGITVETNTQKITLNGAVSHLRAKLVSINDLEVDVTIESGDTLLICENEDKPGMIGILGMALASCDINISTMQVARRKPRTNATMIVVVDDIPSDKDLEKLSATDGIKKINLVHL